MRNPAHRGATAGLSNAFRQVSDERSTASRPFRQDLFVARRFGLPPATAALIAELAYGRADSWRARA
ncbi:MAG: hypothetical protein CMH16_02125 [Methylobacterium sp.]|nr:hypothetical protein [Methylobacterium sp.]